MKCIECDAAIKDFFKCAPDKYVCTDVKKPFVIEDPNVECTEYGGVELNEVNTD